MAGGGVKRGSYNMQAVDSQPHPFSSFCILLKNIMPVISETGNDKRYLKNAGGREVIQRVSS